MVIETKGDFSKYLNEFYDSEYTFLHIIGNNFNDHAALLNPCVVYLKNYPSDNGYIISISHPEATTLDIDHVIKHLSVGNDIYVLDKKKINHFIGLQLNVRDLNLINHLSLNPLLDEESYLTPNHITYRSLYGDYVDLNKVIPIYDHLSLCDKLSVDVDLSIKNMIKSEYFDAANDIILNNLYRIERSGLKIESELFNNHFNKSANQGFVYTDYNINTSTGRPSNSFDQINFAALNKSDDSRKVFVSRFEKEGFLMNVDYDAYHVRLIASLIGYEFEENVHVHDYFGKQYFSKETLSYDEYNQSKQMTFKYLYGTTPQEIIDKVPYHNMIDRYIKNLWNDFEQDGEIYTPLFKKPIKNSESDFYPKKLFNYLIQSYETERNSIVIKRLLDFLESFESKLILYTYDSFLFDINLSDGKDCIKGIMHILRSNDFPVKVSIGKNYQNMKSYNF